MYLTLFLFVVNGIWGIWGAWGSCTTTCDDGIWKRYRPCDNPAPAHGGSYCQGSNNSMTTCYTTCPGIFTIWLYLYYKMLIPFELRVSQKWCFNKHYPRNHNLQQSYSYTLCHRVQESVEAVGHVYIISSIYLLTYNLRNPGSSRGLHTFNTHTHTHTILVKRERRHMLIQYWKQKRG